MPEDEIDVGVGDELAARVDCVRIAGPSDPRPVDHLPDGAEVDLGNHRAASGRPLGDGHRQVRRAILEVDRTEIPVLRPRDEELWAPGEIGAAADPVGFQRGGSNLLPPVRAHVAHPADGAVAVEEPMEVLVSLPQSGRSARRGRLRDSVELQQQVLHELLDRGRRGGSLVEFEPRQRAFAVLIREVELREPDRDHRCDNQGHDDSGVFPDQPPVGYRYTSSARMIICWGTRMPSLLAVLRLIANSTSGTTSTARSAGGVPRRMRST